MNLPRVLRAALVAPSLALLFTLAPGAATDAAVTWDGSQPAPGVYFYWYEPSFYVGSAPRSEEPERLHIRLSRGNQLRLTLVLGEADLDAYLDDLVLRRATYQELIDAGVIELTTNLEYERFVAALAAAGVEEAAAARGSLGPEAYRRRTVEIMSRLNPGRVFRIRMPVDELVTRWHGLLTSLDTADLASAETKLDAANALLPGRLNLHELGAELDASLARAAEQARAGGPTAASFRQEALALLERASKGRYPVRGDFVEAVEFTAIYPAGTVEAWVDHDGARLPSFGVTGIWKLIPRTQGRGKVGMVDYLSTNPGYGFITMLPYQHAGGIAYNAFHNAGVRSALGSTPFLPPEWRRVSGERSKKPYQNLWIVSRGPTSHGCTRLASGHMSEMRQVLPTDSVTLERVETFRNLPQCYDAFDIDGDGALEVMGVRYYLAFRSKDHTPVAAYVSNRREPFYAWLYGENVRFDASGSATLSKVPTCRYVGRKAGVATVFQDMPLYEAEYHPDSIQFYRVKRVSFDSPKGFEFNRELRKVGRGHEIDRARLLLE